MKNFAKNTEPTDSLWHGTSIAFIGVVVYFWVFVDYPLIDGKSVMIWLLALLAAILGSIAISTLSNLDHDDVLYNLDHDDGLSDEEQYHHDRTLYRVINFLFALTAIACVIDFIV